MDAEKLTLVINVGSSNVKVRVYATGQLLQLHSFPARTASLQTVLGSVGAGVNATAVRAVGHRVVHGGAEFVAPTKITDAVLAQLDALTPFAPLHLPPAIALIRELRTLWPTVPQVACFDTAFHATLPPVEQRYGIPRAYHDAGIRRYGFHGLSYEYIASRLPSVSQRAATGKTVVCHLGSGASVCGMLAGKSVTTTMGFSPLDGLLMATRCGRIDPGVVLYLLQQRGMTAEQVQRVLERESGLLGVSGISADMRVLLKDSTPAAAEAVELFCHMVAKEIAAAAVTLDGLDAIVFTAGVGENSPAIRQRVTAKLRWLGVDVDSVKNESNSQFLQSSTSVIEVLCLPTDEEQMIAQHTANVLE